MPQIYYGFWENPGVRYFYWTTVLDPSIAMMYKTTDSLRIVHTTLSWLRYRHNLSSNFELLPIALEERSCTSL